jgi:hypothetical protein
MERGGRISLEIKEKEIGMVVTMLSMISAIAKKRKGEIRCFSISLSSKNTFKTFNILTILVGS